MNQTLYPTFSVFYLNSLTLSIQDHCCTENDLLSIYLIDKDDSDRSKILVRACLYSLADKYIGWFMLWETLSVLPPRIVELGIPLSKNSIPMFNGVLFETQDIETKIGGFQSYTVGVGQYLNFILVSCRYARAPFLDCSHYIYFSEKRFVIPSAVIYEEFQNRL